MQINFLIIAIAALIPTVTGFIWYNPKVLGNAWMNAAGLTEEQLKGFNMPLVLGVSLLLSFLLGMSVNFMVIHQLSVYSIFAGDPTMQDPTSASSLYVQDFMAKYGQNYRTFKHGAFHGILSGFLFVLPVLGTNALFERKGFKYIAINVGYWMVTLGLMGGVICAFA
jgi:hypothetical protein